MNYLDNPLYPKELIHTLFANGTLILDSDSGFMCDDAWCTDCPANGRNVFCSVDRRKHERIAIIDLMRSTHPEYFI